MEKNNKSYKDESSRIIYYKDKYLRLIDFSYRNEYDHLIYSGLYNELLKKNLIIRHKEIFIKDYANVYKILLPEQLKFIIYPYELTLSGWEQIASVFLEINLIALKYGMILKDATPYNICYIDGLFKLIDTTSFQFLTMDNKWVAYYQFCREILSPFTLLKYSDAYWTKLLIADKYFFPLKFVSKVLPIKTYFSFTILLHIHINSFVTYNNINDNLYTKKNSLESLNLELIFKLLKKYFNNKSKYDVSFWSDYYGNKILSQSYIDTKYKLVKKIISERNFHSICDLGCNTGEFSLLASKFSSRVISIENDFNSLNNLLLYSQKNNIRNIYPLFCDLSQLHPGIGVGFSEFDSISNRAKSTCVFALALIHHLCITNYFSFNQFFDLLDNFSERYILIEFVDENDPRVIELIGNRTDCFHYYSNYEFMKTIKTRYIIEMSSKLSDTRSLYFLKKINEANSN